MSSAARLTKSARIEALCKKWKCDPDMAKRHWHQYVKANWHPHPSMTFKQWWEPFGFDEKTGAYKGGHPEAYRLFARPEPDGTYSRASYGINTTTAWNTRLFHDEFQEWRQLGCPERPNDYISISAPFSRQKEFWAGINPVLNKIGNQSWWKARPVVIWDDEEIPNTSDFQTHVKWLQGRGISPAIVHKKLP